MNLPAGIYVFIDSAAATESVTKAIPMIVASGTVNTGKKALTDPIQGANTVNMKNTNNPGRLRRSRSLPLPSRHLTYTLPVLSRTQLRPSSSSPISRARV